MQLAAKVLIISRTSKQTAHKSTLLPTKSHSNRTESTLLPTEPQRPDSAQSNPSAHRATRLPTERPTGGATGSVLMLSGCNGHPLRVGDVFFFGRAPTGR